MRSRAPLAALLLLAFAPSARADSCEADGFTVEKLSPHCGVPASNDPLADPTSNPGLIAAGVLKNCSNHIQRVLGGCREQLKSALIDKLRAERLPPSPERDAALEKAQTAFKRTDEAFARLREDAERSQATDPEEPNPYRVSALAFHWMQKTYSLPPTSQVDAEIGSATLGAQKTVDLAPDDGSGRQAGPPVSTSDVKRYVDLANRLTAPPANNPKAEPKPEVLATAADLYLLAGRPENAVGPAERIVEKAPRDPRGPSILAAAALSRGKPEEAAAWAERALALDPNDKRAKSALAYARAQLSADRLKKPMVGNFEEARDRDLAGGVAAGGAAPARPGAAAGAPKAAEPETRVLAGLLRRGFEKMNLGDLTGGLEDVSLHLDSHPQDLYARLIRAEILMRLGKPDAALADIDLALAKAPEDPRALRARAAALYELKRDEEALRAIEKALALEPASGIAHLTRAKILERMGRIAEAVAEYRAAAQLDPSLSPIVDAALRRLGVAGAAPSEEKPVERRLLRGGLLVVSLSLVLLGLLGGAVYVTRRRAATRAAAAASREKTLGKGDLVAGQYLIVRELGRGGMGVVFEALDERLKRPVALKQLQGELRASAEEAARFLQEARLVAQLKHPNVAEIHAAVEDGGLFLVFELVKGRPLDSLLGRGLSPEQARGIVSHVCSALTAAHARRIVHRDLKPSNLMVADDGTVKVMDFGIAHQSTGQSAFTATAASGTPPYMAPEQAMGSVSAASDLYALGVMAYELLTGARPFEGPDFLGPKMRGEFPPATSKRPGLPAKLDAFFASALSPDPARRPADAAAFAAAFAACWS